MRIKIGQLIGEATEERSRLCTMILYLFGNPLSVVGALNDCLVEAPETAWGCEGDVNVPTGEVGF